MNSASIEGYSKFSPIALAIAAGKVSAVLGVICVVGMSTMMPMMNGGRDTVPSMGLGMDVLVVVASAILGALLGAALAWIYNVVLDWKSAHSTTT